MGHPVVHFQIGAKDDQAAAAFYGKLFGWKIEPVPNMPYHLIQTGSKDGIQGGIAKADKDEDAVVTFYVEVPDVAEALRQAESLGARVTQPANQVMPELTLGMFVDPQGRAVGLSTTLRPAQAPASDVAVEPSRKPARKKKKPAKKALPKKKKSRR